MGFGVSATHTIFFIAAIVISVGVVGAFQTNVSKFSGDISSRSETVRSELTTDIRIINDPADMPNNPLVIYVMNTGSKNIDPNSTILLVNGEARTSLAFDVLDTAEDNLRPGYVLKVTVTGLNLPSGDHRVKAIVGHGVADTLRFHIA